MKKADIAEVYRHVFSTPEGKRVLEDLIENHFICASVFENANDPFAIVAYREGGKNAVLRILALAGKKLEATEI